MGMFMEPSPQIAPLLSMDIEKIGTPRCLRCENLKHIKGLILLVDGAATMFDKKRLDCLDDLRLNSHISWKPVGRTTVFSRRCWIYLIVRRSLRPEVVKLIE